MLLQAMSQFNGILIYQSYSCRRPVAEVSHLGHGEADTLPGRHRMAAGTSPERRPKVAERRPNVAEVSRLFWLKRRKEAECVTG